MKPVLLLQLLMIKKISAQLLHFKKVKVHTMFLAQEADGPDVSMTTVEHCTAHLMKTRKLKNY